MKTKKLIPLILICFMVLPLAAFTVPHVAAVNEVVISYNDFSNDSAPESYLAAVQPSTDGVPSALCMSFKPSENSYVTGLTVQIKIDATTNAQLRAKIYNVTSQGYNSKPTGTALATSTNIITPSATSYSLYTFNFAGTYLLDSTKYYAFTIEVISTGLLDGSHKIYFAVNTVGVVQGYGGTWNTNQWWSFTDYDPCYYLLGTYSDQTPTATRTPTATATAPAWTNFWDSLAPFGNLLLVLLIILGVSITCGYFGGVWGFLAGINVSIILIYATMGTAYMPLWAVVFLGIADISILFLGTQGVGRKKGD